MFNSHILLVSLLVASLFISSIHAEEECDYYECKAKCEKDNGKIGNCLYYGTVSGHGRSCQCNTPRKIDPNEGKDDNGPINPPEDDGMP